MNIEEVARRARENRLGQIEQARTQVSTVSTEAEDQKSPTLITIGEKVKSFAKPEDMVTPEKSGVTVFRIKPNQEKLDFMISWAEVTKSAILEPAASVLGKIIKTKGVIPEEYGDDQEKGMVDAETEIIDLALEHGVKPLFYKADGQPEDGVFVIPGKGIVFVEEFSKSDLVDATHPDKLLPQGENPFGEEWTTLVPLENHAGKPVEDPEAPKPASLEKRREEIQRMMFKNEPGKVTKITAFFQTEPVAQLPSAKVTDQEITSGSGPSSEEPAIEVVEGTNFVAKRANIVGFDSGYNSNKDQVS